MSRQAKQNFNAAGATTDTLKFNSKIPQPAPNGQAAKPVTVKFSQKTSLPLRPAELINKILTSKPAIIAGGDEIVNETPRVYIPEFELAV